MFSVKQLVEALNQEHAAYVIIGGVAAVVQGATYVTEDLDVCYERTAENHERICKALRPFNPRLRGAPAGLPFKFDARTLKSGLNFTLSTDAGDIDLLGEVSGLGTVIEVKANSTSAVLYGANVFVLTLEGLIAAKQAAGRTKDLLHLSELRALQALRAKPQQP